jgi:hypothetical protein
MKTKNLFWISLVFFLAVMAGMLWSEQQAGCGKIIIPLEMAENIAAFKQMVANCNLLWIERNTELDFLFLISYTATLIFAFRWLMGHLAMRATLLPLTWLLVVPALCDAVENVHLIKFLHADEATVSTGTFGIYYWCVRVKFALLVIALVILLVLLGKRFFGKQA